MPGLPSGTVTLLFIDIEHSTQLLRHLGDQYADLLADYLSLLRDTLQKWGGQEVDTQGEGVFTAFPRARNAVRASVAIQRSLTNHPWPQGVTVRARIGVHTGEPLAAATGYVGMDVHRAARIGAAGHGGQILLSETTRDLVAEDLPEEAHLRDLGEHRLKGLARPVRIFQVVVPDLPGDFPPLRSLEIFPHNLPVQLTSFVGREREIPEIKRLLTITRLLTLTGVGGSGKTRLALRVGADLLEQFPDGVWLVELSALADPALVPQSVAATLGLRENADTVGSLGSIFGRVRERLPLDRLIDYLQPKHLLLILDNCEHLLSECARLANALLRTCPRLRIIASSREGLGVESELIYHVPSLSTPAADQMPPQDSVSRYEAVRLFVERAVLSQPHFVLTTQNAAPVVQICQRLDGIPLAIELAAGRVKALSVEEINARLHERFRLLTGGSRTALPRHRTLHAAMDWSYDLLSAKERMLLRRLAVFVGGWALEAAETVCAGDGLSTAEVFDLLVHLVEKSLVVAEEQEGRSRYLMLETVRQYSQEKLLETGEEAAVRRRHLDWYLSLAEAPGSGALEPKRYEKMLEQFATEHGNFRAALEWSLGSGESALALRLASALWLFWWLRGHRAEGRAWFDKAFSASKGVAPEIRARALWRAAELSESGSESMALAQESLALSKELGLKEDMAYSLGLLGARDQDVARAEVTLAESLALFREIGHKPGMALMMESLAFGARLRCDYEKAATLGTEALALWKDVGSRTGLASTLQGLANLAQLRGDPKRAKEFAAESLALARELGDKPTIAAALSELGRTALAQGDFRQAVALHEESLHLCREMGSALGIAINLALLGNVAASQGEYSRATSLLAESLTLSRAMDYRWRIAFGLRKLGELGAGQGQFDRASRLLGASEALRDTHGIGIQRHEHAGYERAVAAARAGLGEERFAAAWAEGRAMPVEQAIEYALMPEGTEPSR